MQSLTGYRALKVHSSAGHPATRRPQDTHGQRAPPTIAMPRSLHPCPASGGPGARQQRSRGRQVARVQAGVLQRQHAEVVAGPVAEALVARAARAAVRAALRAAARRGRGRRRRGKVHQAQRRGRVQHGGQGLRRAHSP